MPPSKDEDSDVGGESEEGWGQENVAVLTYSVGPSYAEVVVAGVRTTVQLEGASPERQQLAQLMRGDGVLKALAVTGGGGTVRFLKSSVGEELCPPAILGKLPP